MDWINKLNNISEKMKDQMHTKGIDSLDKIYVTISKCDQENTGSISKINFETFLSSLGIFLKTQELSELHKHLYTLEHDNQVLFENFIGLFKCEMPASIENNLSDMFEALQDEEGHLPLENAKERLVVDNHPRVRLMQVPRETVQADFEFSFNFIVGDKGYLDLQDFLEFHRNMYWVTPREHLTNFLNTCYEIWGFK